MIPKRVNLQKPSNGFTLMEMTVVLVVMGCLILFLLPTVISRQLALYTLDREMNILTQDFQTLRLLQYSKTNEQTLIQLRWRNDGKGYLVMANERLLWQREFQTGHSCLVPTTGRIIYFKSYHSTYSSTWYCQSKNQAYEVKFLLGNYQMIVEKVR